MGSSGGCESIVSARIKNSRPYRGIAVLACCGLLAVGIGCSSARSSATVQADHSGGGTGFSADSGSPVDASASSTSDAGDAEADCYRDPYLPDNYQPPCEQPPAKPNCSNGWCTIEPGCFIMGELWCQWVRAAFSNNPTQVTLSNRCTNGRHCRISLGDPAKVLTRTNRSGDTAARVEFPDKSVLDVSPDRVKEFVPNTHPKAPPGTLQKVPFENAQPGSKGYKRDPTPSDLEWLK